MLRNKLKGQMAARANFNQIFEQRIPIESRDVDGEYKTNNERQKQS